MGRHRAARTVRPHLHLEPATTPTAPTRIRRALQHAPTAPQLRATRAQHCRSCRVSARPADPTTPHLQRTHQRVPPSSLNDSDNGQPITSTSASTRPLSHPRADINVDDARQQPNTFPAPTRANALSAPSYLPLRPSSRSADKIDDEDNDQDEDDSADSDIHSSAPT